VVRGAFRRFLVAEHRHEYEWSPSASFVLGRRMQSPGERTLQLCVVWASDPIASHGMLAVFRTADSFSLARSTN
jgi:hypothetical protein